MWLSAETILWLFICSIYSHSVSRDAAAAACSLSMSPETKRGWFSKFSMRHTCVPIGPVRWGKTNNTFSKFSIKCAILIRYLIETLPTSFSVFHHHTVQCVDHLTSQNYLGLSHFWNDILKSHWCRTLPCHHIIDIQHCSGLLTLSCVCTNSFRKKQQI